MRKEKRVGAAVRMKPSEGKMPMPPKPVNVSQRPTLESRVFGATAQNTERMKPSEGKTPMPPKPVNVSQRPTLGSRVFGATAENAESPYSLYSLLFPARSFLPCEAGSFITGAGEARHFSSALKCVNNSAATHPTCRENLK